MMALLKREKIKLPNRDGADLYLIETTKGSDLYTLECDKAHEYILDYACITLAEDNRTFIAFDPSGGPYLNVGYKLDDKEIKAIFEFDGSIVFLIK